MNCGVGHRCGLDLALLWLWCRLAAVALIGPLAWEPPYAVGVVLKSTHKKKCRASLCPQIPASIFPKTETHTDANVILNLTQEVAVTGLFLAAGRRELCPSLLW